MPFWAASEALSTLVTTTPSLSGPVPGATLKPSWSISVACGSDAGLPLSTLASSLPEGNLPSLTATVCSF